MSEPQTMHDHIADRTSQNRCGRGSLVRLNLITYKITVVPLTCKSWRCKKCGPKLVTHWRNKIAEARPRRFITLTWDPKFEPDPDIATEKMKRAFARLVRLLRNKGYIFEYCAVWEFTKKGYPHIHIAQKGSYVPQKVLSAKWLYLRAGQVTDIRAVKSTAACAQELTKYLMKSTAITRDQMPNMRLVQASKNFFDPPAIAQGDRKVNPSTAIFIALGLSQVVESIEHYFHYQLLAVDHDGTSHLFPCATDDLNEIIPKGFEDLAAVLAPLRRSSLTSPPDSDLTFHERADLFFL